MTRDEILNEIRQTAADNGGKPLGRERFVRITGITEYEVGRYWVRYGDAVREAGFEPNKLNAAHGDDFLIEKFIGLTRKLGHVPTNGEMRLERTGDDPVFPSAKVYERFGSKNDLIGHALSYSRERSEYDDAVEILELVYVPTQSSDGEIASSAEADSYGFVYLLKGHPGEYKIGRTNLVDRRLSELGATSAVEQQLVHEIKTDDPAGVEMYWHNRFATKRMRGEWFRLTATDVRAFKRWRRVY
jgi:hypothetical protein